VAGDSKSVSLVKIPTQMTFKKLEFTAFLLDFQYRNQAASSLVCSWARHLWILLLKDGTG